MKTTISLPDELHRKVKVKTALEGRTIREVAEELFRSYVGEREGEDEERETREEPTIDGEPAPPWFGMLRKYARQAEYHDMESIRESIARGVSGERDV